MQHSISRLTVIFLRQRPGRRLSHTLLNARSMQNVTPILTLSAYGQVWRNVL